jgi:3',5'-cyclic AMP phosphodiesterase CpdA
VRIAHLSDLHMLCMEGARPHRFLNKRITGYQNLRFRRSAVHKPFAVRAAAREIRRLAVDHVVITGDVSNLALEGEFDLVRTLLEQDLALPPDRVSIVPGNHDAYTRGAHRSARFQRAFEPFVQSDLPALTALGPFPFVRLRGPVAIIGMSTALPRLPLVASGALGQVQLKALDRVLAHPEVRDRTPVVLQHHPWHNPVSPSKRLLQGLDDADAEWTLLRRLSRGLLLHGHLHRRILRALPTDRGQLHAVGATSASLLDDSDEKMAGFNLYEISDSGAIETLTSMRLDPTTETFREVPIPRE